MANPRLVAWLQLLMLVTFTVFEGLVLLAFRGVAPSSRMLAATALVAVYSLYGGARLVLLFSGRGGGERTAGGALLLDDTTILSASVAIVGVLWLLFPYADADFLYAYAVACVTAMSGFAISAIRRVPDKRTWLALSALPACLTLFLLWHGEFLSLLVAFAIAANWIGLLVGRQFISTIMTDADRAFAELAQGRDVRTRFLAAASHDLGQPIQAARLFFEQMLAAGDKAAREAAAAKAARALDSTEALVRQMLDYLRLDAGRITARIVPLELGPVIAGIAEAWEELARANGMDIIAVSSSRAVSGDAALIERCLGNFVGNAIRHAKARRILIGVRRGRDIVRVCVLDDGVGVAPALRDSLFDDFSPGAGAGEGFGLGLASARRIAALIDARVGYRPGRSRGSVFWLELPAASRNNPRRVGTETLPDLR